jgi:hypothetical protein
MTRITRYVFGILLIKSLKILSSQKRGGSRGYTSIRPAFADIFLVHLKGGRNLLFSDWLGLENQPQLQGAWTENTGAYAMGLNREAVTYCSLIG